MRTCSQIWRPRCGRSTGKPTGAAGPASPLLSVGRELCRESAAGAASRRIELKRKGGPARLLALTLRGAIRAYQLLISPAFPPSCRYYPSCSHYAAEAVERHGPWHGSLLAARRLLRCHPWGGSGYDPVPLERGR